MLKATGGVPLDVAAAQLPPEAREQLDAAHKAHREKIEALEAEREEKIAAIKKGS